MLKLIANQWLIEINAYGMMDNVNLSNGNTLTLLAVQFQIMDQYGAVIDKLICQFAPHTKWTHHLRDNCVQPTFLDCLTLTLNAPLQNG